MNQRHTPLFDAIQSHHQRQPVSMHVPGHKNGRVFPEKGRAFFETMLSIDYTELTNLDDLHEPEGCIKEAQELAAQWFGARESFFLIGGSTVGNLAMILAVHQRGKPIIVQRDCHKSVMHGLELAGALPVFVAPSYDSSVDIDGTLSAMEAYPDASGVVLTYPTYFGHTYHLERIIKRAKELNILVLVDEAHGVHFSHSDVLPPSALELGADVVVQSAHKMAPSMTMGSYLHIAQQAGMSIRNKLANYLQMVQSSSPSYPIMASLDLARYYLANVTKEALLKSILSVSQFREGLAKISIWDVAPCRAKDDPFKVTIRVKDWYDAQEIASILEAKGFYPELVYQQSILLLFGLEGISNVEGYIQIFQEVEQEVTAHRNTQRATIEAVSMFEGIPYQKAAYHYLQLSEMETEFVLWHEVENRIACNHIIPYPPGIPLIMKGERVTKQQVDVLHTLLKQRIHIQTNEASLEEGMHVYRERR
ncbi:aminotransferase class I/II-fold pyridoxal phosphate-dependent enzyme [Pontibacillus salicampi]|uniref:Aminotransferase class I/II-fold pyridoxal phosphate-dependent enzyme n=1 Tax=Pontibacillus salicampi TaxID=1449801 RepID=A0ABV6LTC5_9BACI